MKLRSGKRGGVSPFITCFARVTVNYPEQDVLLRSSSRVIELGYAIKSRTSARVGIPLENLFEHALVAGSTGSGKTYTVSKIVNEIASKKYSLGTIVFDWHGEYRSLVEGYSYVDPYDHPIDLFSDLYSLVDLLVDALELTPSQAYLLEKILRQFSRRVDSLSSLVNVVDSYSDESNWMRESRLSLLRKLSLLSRDNYEELFSGERSANPFFVEKSDNVYILDVSRIRDVLVRRIYTALTLKKVLSYSVNSPSRRGLLIVLEEAQNVVDRERPLKLISSMLAEVRKFSVGLVIVSQSPFKLLEDVMINTNTKIVHSVKSSIDLEIISRVLYLPSEYQKLLPYLDVGEAILYTRGLKKPVLVKVS